jgi:hypothetical protein
MKAIVPPGYAVPKKEIARLTEELRQTRSAELARADDKGRARIEKEIAREVQRKAGRKGGWGGLILHLKS